MGSTAGSEGFQNRDPPLLDGRVDKEEWQAAAVATDFVQQFPAAGSQASEKTEARFLYTAEFLYIGVICYDSQPDKIVDTQSRRDGDLGDSDSILCPATARSGTFHVQWHITSTFTDQESRQAGQGHVLPWHHYGLEITSKPIRPAPEQEVLFTPQYPVPLPRHLPNEPKAHL